MQVYGSTDSVIQKTDYYPFGKPYPDGLNPERQPYKFGGKEYDEMHGLNAYDFEARHLDANIPRFTTMDPLCEKYYSLSPYAYCLNNPVNQVDPTGLDSYIVLYSTDDERFKAAAETRQRQIENSKGFDSSKDHVYALEIGDLGTLSDRVSGIVQDATDNGYGMTVEASFYTHGGADGPVGDATTSGDYNLSNVTGQLSDNKQLTGEGWSNINWNFDSNNSVAAFYGCRTAGFAERFFDYSNVQYTAGQGARVGPSYSTDNFDSVGYLARAFGTSSNVYYGDNIGGKFYGVSVYGRNMYENTQVGRERKIFEVNGNVGVRGGKLYKYK
jgi:RHS repeat-associated protein